jgi:5-methylcytosine-specific restriction enzyme subunit McrC
MTMTRRLTLTEFKPEPAVSLSSSERDGLRRLHAGLKVEPTLGFEGRYDVTADQHIGIVSLPGLEVEIRPKIPMSSALFLVSYACEAVSWFDQQPEFAHDTAIGEIIAIILARTVEQATRRGLLHGYQSEDESMQAPRGRVLFDEQIRRRFAMSPPVEVRHDVFTSDMLENRLLLAALAVLGHMVLRSKVAKREIARAQRLLGGVSRLHFARATVPEIVFTRLNRHYQPALTLASLVLRSTSIDVGGGAARGSAFLVDMNAVFERFVRRALRDTLGVGARTLPDRVPPSTLDTAGVVPLRPDLCAVEDQRIVWVGDAKYKRLPSGAYQNADLYQLLAYTTVLGLPSGTLIYAADKGVKSADHVVARSGKLLQVQALDLAAPPSSIRQQLAAIASRTGLVSQLSS